MKYIIDIEDEYTKDWVNETPMCKELCMPISVPNRQRTYHVITGLKLEPYTEPDRKAIEDEVWEFATTCTKMDGADSVDVFGGFSLDSFTKYSYQEAKAKYDAWKQEKEEIRVGCEVHHKELPELKIYVTDMDDNSFGGFALCSVKNVCDYGDRFSECNVHQYKPTGRVLPNIVELLKKMMEEE